MAPPFLSSVILSTTTFSRDWDRGVWEQVAKLLSRSILTPKSVLVDGSNAGKIDQNWTNRAIKYEPVSHVQLRPRSSIAK